MFRLVSTQEEPRHLSFRGWRPEFTGRLFFDLRPRQAKGAQSRKPEHKIQQCRLACADAPWFAIFVDPYPSFHTPSHWVCFSFSLYFLPVSGSLPLARKHTQASQANLQDTNQCLVFSPIAQATCSCLIRPQPALLKRDWVRQPTQEAWAPPVAQLGPYCSQLFTRIEWKIRGTGDRNTIQEPNPSIGTNDAMP